MEKILKIIAEAEEKLYSKSMVTELSGSDVTDYHRGIIAGRIEAINQIKREIQG